jgi:hypothetical protein
MTKKISEMTTSCGAAFAAVLTFGSCGAGLLDTVNRVAADPIVVAPTVTSFHKSLAIDVSWEEDPGAEEYQLYRALDADIPVYSIIYRGDKLLYEDRACGDRERYLYVLCKTRGSKLFGPSDPILGFASAVTNDAFEPNNTKAQATILNFTDNANLPFFQSEAGEISTDADWFAVDVPGRMRAVVQVHQSAPAPSNVGGQLMTRLRYAIDEYLVDRAGQDVDILLENNDVYPKRIYIQLYTTADVALDYPAQGGGIIISYSIKLVRIEAL